jgi:hypothetical protein
MRIRNDGIAKPDEHANPSRFQPRIADRNCPLQARLIQFRLPPQIRLQGG